MRKNAVPVFISSLKIQSIDTPILGSCVLGIERRSISNINGHPRGCIFAVPSQGFFNSFAASTETLFAVIY